MLCGRKCAIFLLQCKNYACDFRKAWLGDITARDTQRIEGGWCAEKSHPQEIIFGKVQRWVDAAARQQHRAHTVSQCGFIERSYVLLVHFGEGSVLNTFLQLYQIAGQLFFHRVLCSQKQSSGQIALLGGEGEALLQLLAKLRHKFGVYFPQRDRARSRAFVCVGDIEIVF